MDKWENIAQDGRGKKPPRRLAWFGKNDMIMKITTEFIKIEINNQNYEMSLHADDEREVKKYAK